MGKKGDKPKISLKNREHKYIIDRVVVITGLIGPLASIPQAVQIYATQDAEGVSLLSWAVFVLVNVAALGYALVHRLPPLVFSNILWVIIELIVVVGILLYP